MSAVSLYAFSARKPWVVLSGSVKEERSVNGVGGEVAPTVEIHHVCCQSVRLQCQETLGRPEWICNVKEERSVNGVSDEVALTVEIHHVCCQSVRLQSQESLGRP